MEGARSSRVPWMALLAVVAWGFSFVAVRVALRAFDPFGLTALRLVAGTALLGLVLRARGAPLVPRTADIPAVVFLGVVLGAHLAIQAWGLVYTSAIHTGWIIGFMPATIALGAHLFLGQRLMRIGWGGIALAALGVLCVTLDEPPDLARARFGDLLQISTCVTWTVYTLAGAGPVARNGGLRVTTGSMGVAALLLSGVASVRGFLVAEPTPSEWGALAFLGLLCSGVALALWYRAQAVHGSHRVGATLYLEPFVTLVAASLLLGEEATPRAFLGGVLVLAGVWLVGRGVRASRGTS